MNNLLVADGGATKIKWAFNGRVIGATEGVNPAVASTETVRRAFGEALPLLDGQKVDAVRYYGAGCLPHLCDEVGAMLADTFGTRDVEVNSDLLGAARALHGYNSGIACILGTGAVAGLYDEGIMTFTAPALGFILGDEGSGASLGKRLVGDLFKGALSAELLEKFMADTGLDAAGIIAGVYLGEAPNRFLGSLAPWISANIARSPELNAMVTDEMERFLRRNVMRIPGFGKYPIGIVGSVASAFAPQLQKAAGSTGLHISKIISDPIEGLLQFHLQ